MDKKMNQRCADIFALIREKKPLVHHITNIVVANDNANAMLAIGALPVMASSQMEVEEMTGQSNALVLNLGTPTPEIVESCFLAGKKANQRGIPVVLDPVGAGATHFRTQTVKNLLSEIKISILRGNPGEIAALFNEPGTMRGVDTKRTLQTPMILAQKASLYYRTVVAVTGKIDYISDGQRIFSVHNGHHWLTVVTGTGCMASSLCGAFAAVEKDHGLSSAAALGFLGVSAEIARKNATGPGSFHYALFDAMYNMDIETFASSLHIEVEA